MATETARDAKLVQYLAEAHSKEKELEVSLQAHIEMTTRQAYKKRLREHLKETKRHAREVERRLKKLGGDTGLLGKAPAVASRGIAAAKGPLHAVRGTGEEEKQLKNAKTEYSEEHEEIATYTAIETLAEEVGDKETAKLARQIRREEERMASFLEKQIPVLTRAVAKAEIPSSERNGSSRRTRRKSSSGGSSSRSKSSGRSGGGSKRSSGSSRAKSGGRSRSAGSGSKSKSSSSRSRSSSRSSGSGRSKSGGRSRSGGSSRSRSRS